MSYSDIGGGIRTKLASGPPANATKRFLVSSDTAPPPWMMSHPFSGPTVALSSRLSTVAALSTDNKLNQNRTINSLITDPPSFQQSVCCLPRTNGTLHCVPQ